MNAPLSPLIHLIDDDGTVELCRRAFKAGATEFLEKPVDDEVLLEALQNAVRRHVHSRERHQADRQAHERYAQLSDREREVLGLSPRTVETHRANLFAKLQVESPAHLIRHYTTLADQEGRYAPPSQ